MLTFNAANNAPVEPIAFLPKAEDMAAPLIAIQPAGPATNNDSGRSGLWSSSQVIPGERSDLLVLR